jgi:hypothetical protein
MYVLRAVINRGWWPILITALAVVGFIFEWEIWVVAPLLGVILVIGLVVVVRSAKERELELSFLKLRQLAGYFTRRFMGDSSLSIFAIIDSLFNIDNPKLWDWARACDVSRRVFNSWGSSFISRVESDVRTRRFNIYLRTYLNELWLVVSHYHEFIEQFYEIAAKVEVPQETINQYNRFVMEYNAFVQNFRDNITELKKVAKTEIEPPSVKLARELSAVKLPQATQDKEMKPPQTRNSRGYYR